MKKRTLVPDQDEQTPRERIEIRGGYTHDSYKIVRSSATGNKSVTLSVRKTNREDSALQIEVEIFTYHDNTGTGKRDSTRAEYGSFCLPAHLISSFIKSCSEIAEENREAYEKVNEK
jgi:hypothetical protein